MEKPSILGELKKTENHVSSHGRVFGLGSLTVVESYDHMACLVAMYS